MNLPVGAAALLLTPTSLHLPARRTAARVDYPGAALLAAGLTSLLLVATWGGREYAWGAAEIGGLAAAAVVLLVAFVFQERRAPEPILPLRLFRDPVFDIVSATLFLTTLAFFAVIVFMPTVPAGRHGCERDRVRPAAAAVADRHGGGHDGVRPRDLAHRPLQGVPGRRPCADVGRAAAPVAH